MARPPTRTVEDKLRVVLAVLRGEVSIKEASRREGVSETSVANWRDQFLAGGRQGLEQGRRVAPSSAEQRLALEVDDLKMALGEAHAELRVLKKGGPGSFRSASSR